MPFFSSINAEGLKRKQLQLERLQAGRFFNVTCEKGHTTQMSGIDLCRRLDVRMEKLDCPECYQQVRLSSIVDGPLMNDEQKKQQADDYLKWSKEREEERKRKHHEASMEAGVWMGWP